MGGKKMQIKEQNVDPADIRGLDERSMIREQDRLAREKKKNINRKKKRIAGAVAAAALAAAVWYLFWGRSILADEQENVVKVTVSAGQKLQYARLTSIKGNEITYTAAEVVESGEEKGLDDAEGAGRDDVELAVPGRGTRKMDSGTVSGGDRLPSGGMAKPDGSGDMPVMPDMSETDGSIMFGSNSGSFGESIVQRGSSDTFTYNGVTYRLTDQSVTALIPVGTDVTTKLGTVTTFSRLAAGDWVALVTEKSGDNQIITAVYIIG